MKKFFAAYKFYFLEGIRAKSFIITIAIMCLGVIGVASFGNMEFNEQAKYGVINESSYTMNEKELEKNLDGVDLIIYDSSKREELRKKVEKRDLDGLFTISEKDGKPVVEESYNTYPSGNARIAITSSLQNQYLQKIAQEEGIQPETINKLFATVEVKEDIVKDHSSTFGVVYIFVFLMYLLIIMFGQSIGTSIASEKSSRVNEVMLSKIHPLQLLYAKITSLLSLALIQIGSLFASFLLCKQLGIVDSDKLEIFGGMLIDFSSVTPSIVIMFIVYFLLGYLLYATLFAGAGALVSRVEDLQVAVTPIIFLVIGAFFVGMFSLSNPTHIVVEVTSYIPFFSPIVTFSRIVSGEAGGMEIGITLLLMSVTIYLLNKFVSRIYLNGIMNYSEKFQWSRVIQFSKKS